jgi:putative proteasome-type protease
MTYCIGIKLDAGMVFLSDSWTNAGVDQVRTFRKTHRFERAGERTIVVQTAGNLALSQAVLSLLRIGFQADAPGATLWNPKTMSDAATVVGAAVRMVYARDSAAMQHFDVEFNLTLIVGGQIRGEPPRLFNVYNVGRADSFAIDQHKLVDDQDAYFNSIRRSWGQQLRKVFDELPNPQWWSTN